MDFKQEVVETIAKVVSLPKEKIEALIERPKM
jgi:arginyl-tRNA synthetase